MVCGWGAIFPSREMGKFLSNIIIVEPIGDWEDSHVRLAGQILMLRFGRDVTGMRGSEVFSDNPKGHQMLCDASRKAVVTRKPFFVDSRVMRNGEKLMHLESLQLPHTGAKRRAGMDDGIDVLVFGRIAPTLFRPFGPYPPNPQLNFIQIATT